MSTRSGKRLHGSFQDNEAVEQVTKELVLDSKTNRKTRSAKRFKENDEPEVTKKSKKRNNYVSFPSEPNTINDRSDEKVSRTSRKTLKEINETFTNVELVDSMVNSNKAMRRTKTKNLAEDCFHLPDMNNIKLVEPTAERSLQKHKKSTRSNEKLLTDTTSMIESESLDFSSVKVKNKKNRNKKNKPRVDDTIGTRENHDFSAEKKTKKKKNKKSNSNAVDNAKSEIKGKNSSNMSADSFHSAAGSPLKHTLESENLTIDKEPANHSNEKKSKKKIKGNKKHRVKNTDISVEKSIGSNVSTDVQNMNCVEKALPLSDNSSSLRDKTKQSNEALELRKSNRISESKALDITSEKIDSKINSTFEKDDSHDVEEKTTVNVTFEKSDDKGHISLASDDSNENIINTSPLLIESSMEDSRLSNGFKSVTPLKREGTFTKECSEICEEKMTPTKQTPLPSPGCTPYHSNSKIHKDKKNLNITHSIEKPTRRSSAADVVPRSTRVMFCSPVNNPAVVAQRKSKVIKSNLKGSNKSFVFDESVRVSRKRSHSLADSEGTRAKRSRLTDDLQRSVDRLSRPRTSSAAAKLDTTGTTPSKKTPTANKTKSESKIIRAKLPNFAALHQKQFSKMESLDECQERKVKRAKQLLVPARSLSALERSASKPTAEIAKLTESSARKGTTPSKSTCKPKVMTTKKVETPTKTKLPTLDSLKPGYTRFGFKMNTDLNPFSIPPKTESKPLENRTYGVLKRQKTLPSINGVTSGRRDVAKKVVLREKSFTSFAEKRNEERKESRTIIKGVRTNRRFELQMKSRNVNV